MCKGGYKTSYTPMKVLLILLVIGAALLVAPNKAGATDPPQPFPGNAHWYRGTNPSALVYYRVDASAKALHPLLADSVNMWNENSPYMQMVLVPLGGSCPGGYHCVTVAEANNYPCSTGDSYLSTVDTPYYHRHFTGVLIAVNLDGCGQSLLYAKYLMCHFVGHSQGVNSGPDGWRPCSPGDGRPTEDDRNVRNYLGVAID